MTSKEILHKIVEAERDARLIYDETASLQEGFDDYINLHVTELRKKYSDEAEKEIAEFDAEEKRKADAEIERLENQLETDIEKAKTNYLSNKERIVDTLFGIVVNGNA